MEPEEWQGLTEEELKRVRERGDASDLVGTVICTKSDGTPVPMLDEDGMELLGIATGKLYVPKE